MKIIALLLILFLLAGCAQKGSIASHNPVLALKEGASVKFGGLEFSTDFERSLEEAKKSGKAVFLYFQSESCFWCKKFEADVLPKDAVKSKLSQDFVLVAVDVDRQKAYVGKYRITGTPTMVFLDSEGREVTRILGYASEEKFLQVLNFVKS